MKQVQIIAEIELPLLPNFFRMTDGHSLPIAAVSEKDLRAIGDAWTAALIEHALKKRSESGERP